MVLSPQVVGTVLPTTSLVLERGRLRLFAKAIGMSDPVYVDVSAARAAGHPDLPAPPTFLAALQHEVPRPLGWLEELGVNPDRVLHGEQSFTYHRMAHAGQELTLTGHISDYADKKGGAMELLTRRFQVTDATGALIADLGDVVVVRNPQVST